jgi:hypothetical protein
MILTFFIGFSKTKSLRRDLDYVVTEKGIFLPNDARQALMNGFYSNTTGNNLWLTLEDIRSFVLNGREYQIKTVTTNGTKKTGKVLLEKLRKQGEYTVFKRVFPNSISDNFNDYYLFRGELQEFRLNADNYKVVLGFFLPHYKQIIA